MSIEPRIYVVDDDASVRKATCRLLKAAGFVTIAFDSAEEFLDYPLGDVPGCLILDYQMPGRDGIELQRQLTSDGIDLPIVFMSGKGDIPTSVTAIKRGAVDFLPKPVEDQVLIDTVSDAIERHQSRRSQLEEVNEFKKRLESLTQRETEVLMLVVEGRLNKQIATKLGVTESTIKVHRMRMMEKAGVESVAELARWCERSGITT